MTRDDDYLRALLIEFEASDHWVHHISGSQMSAEAAHRRHYHILLLVDAGLMASVNGTGSPYRITNQGHDFLAVTRKSEAWEATKAATKHMGGASVQMLYRVAESLARQKLVEIGILPE